MTAPNTSALRQLMTKMFSTDNAQLDVQADDMELVSKAIDELRTNILFSPDIEDEQFGLISMQDYLLGLNALEQAQRHFAKCAYFRAGELSGRF